MVGTVFLLVFNIAVCFSYFRYYDILRNAGTYVMVKSLRRNFEVWTLTFTANSALHFGSCCKSLDSGGLTISPLEFGQRGLGLKPGRVVVLGSLEGHFALTRPLSTSPGLSPSRSVFGIRKLSRKLDKMPWRGG